MKKTLRFLMMAMFVTIFGIANAQLTTIYDFDDSTLQGWTTIDGGTPTGYGWSIGSSVLGTGYGHNGTADLVISQSYDNNYGVIYPDNYLISPSKDYYSEISFFACAQDNGYAAEHFGVAVSTTDASASSFTIVQEWTLTAKGSGVMAPGRNGQTRAQGNWYEYTVDLSSYAGQEIWVAVRHFNCSDMYFIDVDDITLTVDDNPMPPVITIDEINVEGFVAPLFGGVASLELSVPEAVPYTIIDAYWWHNGILSPGAIFEASDEPYYMGVVFEAEPGYAFSPDAIVLFNGDATINDVGENVLYDDGTFEAFTIDFIVVDNTMVNEFEENTTSVYPNPANDLLFINGMEGKTVRVFDVMGRQVMQERYEGNLNVSSLAPGIYAVKADCCSVRFVKE